MATTISFIKFFQYLRLSQEFCDDLKRTNKSDSLAFKMFNEYSKRINWILTDVITNPKFPDVIRNELRKEMDSDLLVISALNDKIHLLPINQREVLENIVDCILKGENIEIEKL